MLFRKYFLSKYRKKLKKIKNKQKELINLEKIKFINTLLHDIKTPILAQIQSLELLLNDSFGKLTKEQKEIIVDILNSNKFLNQNVLNAIFLAKYEIEKPKLTISNINMKNEIENCLEALDVLIKNKNQKFILDIPSDLQLNADKKMVQKIILNIVSSSCSFGFENSDIEISMEDNPDSIAFCAKNKSAKRTKVYQ